MKNNPRPTGPLSWLYRWRNRRGRQRWARRQTWLSEAWIETANRPAVDPDPSRPVRHLLSTQRGDVN